MLTYIMLLGLLLFLPVSLWASIMQVFAAIIINVCYPVLYDIQKQAQNPGLEFQGLKLTSKVRSGI